MAQRYAFIAEWLDPNTAVLWRYQLFWYPDTLEIEMVRAAGTKACTLQLLWKQSCDQLQCFTLLQFDIKNRRHFLKRVKYDGVTLQQLYLGSTVVVYARQLRLIEYGDQYTRQCIEACAER